ncbi:MAG: hypothetical protein H8D72_00900, partial [Planctomycetes bacterium]|nr:hypothetical protein [Planctomycetota bacterium]
TTGLGADAIGLQERGFRVLASDLDLLTAQIAGFNLGAVAGSRTPARAFAADATHPPLATGLGELLLLFDPDRRALESSNTRGRPGGGRRRLDPASFSPPLTEWGALLASVAGAAIKLPPGLDPASLEESGPLAAFLERTPHRWTWTESGGELRELTLWTGQLAPPGEAPRTAVRVFGPGLPPSGEDPVAAQLSGQPEGQHFGELPDPETLTWIAEARPSARRSGLAGTACRAALPSATPIDEGLSYWATSQAEAPSAPTDFADVFQVLASAPLDKKHARRMLREHDVGPLTVKKRGLDESSATLASRIALKTGRPGLVIATPTRSGRRLFLVERLARNAEESPT